MSEAGLLQKICVVMKTPKNSLKIEWAYNNTVISKIEQLCPDKMNTYSIFWTVSTIRFKLQIIFEIVMLMCKHNYIIEGARDSDV